MCVLKRTKSIAHSRTNVFDAYPHFCYNISVLEEPSRKRAADYETHMKEQYVAPNLTWIHLRDPDRAELTTLAKEFGFSMFDVEDVYIDTQRSKIEVYDDYAFFVLRFPSLDKEDRSIESAEIDFFVTPTHLITITHAGFAALEAHFAELRENNGAKLTEFHGPMELAISTLKEVISSLAPIMKRIASDIDEVEHVLFREPDQQTYRLSTSLNLALISIQKTLGPARTLLADLEAAVPESLQESVSDVRDIAERLWDDLISEDAILDELQRMEESLLSSRTNRTIKTLTVFSVLLMPVSIIAGSFGTNFTSLPFIDHPYGFWIMIGLMLAAIGGLSILFRKNRLL